MGLFDSLFKGKRHFPASVREKISNRAEELIKIVNESLSLASSEEEIQAKKTRLDIVMTKLVELIKLANEYPFLDFKRISMMYDSVRQVRNEIKEMEAVAEGHLMDVKAESFTADLPKSHTITEPGEAAFCPHCNYRFTSMPERKSTCPSCKQTILVWYSTTQNMKKLITEEEAERLKKQISEYIQQYELIHKDEIFDSADEVVKIQSGLKKSDPEATLDDAYLVLLDKKLKSSRNYSEKSRLYYLKALMLDTAGKDFIEELTESKRCELLDLRKHDFIRKVQITSNHDSCAECKKSSDRVMSIEEAIREMPLPHKKCERPLAGEKGFCRCTYLIINE